jgi:hypothetical protein
VGIHAGGHQWGDFENTMTAGDAYNIPSLLDRSCSRPFSGSRALVWRNRTVTQVDKLLYNGVKEERL